MSALLKLFIFGARMRFLTLILIFFIFPANSNGWSNTPYFKQQCDTHCNYTPYWSKEPKLVDAQIPLVPPFALDVENAEIASIECEKVLPLRYSKKGKPDDIIRWFMLTECMNSKGWFLKVSPYNNYLR